MGITLTEKMNQTIEEAGLENFLKCTGGNKINEGWNLHIGVKGEDVIVNPSHFPIKEALEKIIAFVKESNNNFEEGLEKFKKDNALDAQYETMSIIVEGAPEEIQRELNNVRFHGSNKLDDIKKRLSVLENELKKVKANISTSGPVKN